MKRWIAVLCGTLFLCSAPDFSATAQNLIDPSESLGPVPGFGGTGLAGLYYDNENGFTSANSSPPEASFTTTNLCFPDCLGTSFSDTAGGLAGFTNGNATNLNFFTSVEPVRLTWESSEIVMEGYIAINTPGTYSFHVFRDDIISITIGGANSSFANCCGDDSFQDTFTARGLYRFSADFMELGGGSRLALSATDPNGNCVLGCLDENNNLEPNDLFYSDADLEGAPAPVIGGGRAALVVAGLMGIEMIRRRRRA
jgi:hypothetical protein